MAKHLSSANPSRAKDKKRGTLLGDLALGGCLPPSGVLHRSDNTEGWILGGRGPVTRLPFIQRIHEVQLDRPAFVGAVTTRIGVEMASHLKLI